MNANILIIDDDISNSIGDYVTQDNIDRYWRKGRKFEHFND